MSNIPRLPGPSDDHREDSEADRDEPQAERRDQQANRRRDRNGHIPTEKQLLETMAKLPPLVLTGMISPAACNAIQGVLRDMLAQLKGSAGPTVAGQRVPASLREALRTNPDLLDFCSALLSTEDLADLLNDEEPTNES